MKYEGDVLMQKGNALEAHEILKRNKSKNEDTQEDATSNRALMSLQKEHKDVCGETIKATLYITSANELKLCFKATGSIRAFICSHASKTAAPYKSELAEAAVGDVFGT